MLVTGGTRGIGRAIAEACAAAGAGVVRASPASPPSSRRPRPRSARSARRSCTVAGFGRRSRRRRRRGRARRSTRSAAATSSSTTPRSTPSFGPLMDADLGAVAKVFDANIAGPLRFVRAAWHAYMQEHGGVGAERRVGRRHAARARSSARTTCRRPRSSTSPASSRRSSRRACASTRSRPALVKTDMARALWEPNEEAMARGARARPPRRPRRHRVGRALPGLRRVVVDDRRGRSSSTAARGQRAGLIALGPEPRGPGLTTCPRATAASPLISFKRLSTMRTPSMPSAMSGATSNTSGETTPRSSAIPSNTSTCNPSARRVRLSFARRSAAGPRSSRRRSRRHRSAAAPRAPELRPLQQLVAVAPANAASAGALTRSTSPSAWAHPPDLVVRYRRYSPTYSMPVRWRCASSAYAPGFALDPELGAGVPVDRALHDRGRAGREHPGRDRRARGDDRAGGDERAGADRRAVEHDRAVGDEALLAEDRAVHHAVVGDGRARPDVGGEAGRSVDAPRCPARWRRARTMTGA